ncbi:hypothetical protein EV702DRAFT_1204617 [Suillus placidus]|uniref:Nephrocystin 3-like N-terminal domain-containing protein n=1 Tax=Suillus placidus TaxID=48579 RepID=A0A9P6ZGK4_9AGAM|nr:hypothetical protein EV702DRAFT_1204617 [Suillus placidus]
MSEGTWEKLSQVAANGAEHDSRERHPHPKCLEGTRVTLLDYIYGLLDKKEKNQIIWLHGTAGVGKSAVAFTVAERMKSLKVTEQTRIETRLAGTFFFSRKHMKRRTTGYFFATLAYQLATNFPSVRTHVNKAILENPALLDPDKSTTRMRQSAFGVHCRCLDECTSESINEDKSESELAELIFLLAQSLCDPELPVTHILVTSRSEGYIHEAMQNKDVRPLVGEIPVNLSGEGVATTISLDGADVDEDIYRFLEDSFRRLRLRYSTFLQPTQAQLERLANRAGRRFIVATTMMKFIDDRNHGPCARLDLMLELTHQLLPGTEVFKLYDLILSTCADPTLAYKHLSVISVLADPLPISQISELLGDGQGRDVEKVLVQLRSIIDLPTDSTLPVNIYHSSVRDYVSRRSNCCLHQVQFTSPHSLLARSSLHLMVHEIPESTALLDVLSELKKHSQAMQPQDPQNLKHLLSFMHYAPDPIQALITLLWLRGNYRSELQFWLDTEDGYDWLQTEGANDWLQSQRMKDWLQTEDRQQWLWTEAGQNWLQTTAGRETEGGQDWLLINPGNWLQTEGGEEWLWTGAGREWLETTAGQDWLQTEAGKEWSWKEAGQDLLETNSGQELAADRGKARLVGGPTWARLVAVRGGTDWLQSWDGRDWLNNEGGRDWLQTENGRDWLQTWDMQAWLENEGRDWLNNEGGQDWLQTENGQAWRTINIWVTMEEFSSTSEAIREYMIAPELSLQPPFQAIQLFKALPDFLMFPVFLALRDQQDYSDTASPDMEIVHAVKAFSGIAGEAWERSQSASGALEYACQNWAIHLSRTPEPWNESLAHVFQSFWNRNLVSWLERQWCLTDLPSCLTILSDGEKLAKEHLRAPES